MAIDVLIAETGDTSGPFAFDRRAPFEIEAEFAKEGDGRVEVFDDDADIVHAFDCHDLVSERG